MITLTGGQFQDASGNLLKKGYLSLQLTQDASIIAGGQVIRAIPLLFPIANGSLSGSVKIYSNAELSGSQYLALVLDPNQKRINDPQVWQFTQATGATVDIGTMVPTQGGVSYPQPVLLNPSGDQVITTGNLSLALGDFNAVVGTYRVNGVAPSGTGELLGRHSPQLITPFLDVATATSIVQPAATVFKLVDNQGGTRYSIPVGGVAQATLNNTSIGGGSTYNGTTPNFQKFIANGTFTIPAGVTGVKVTVVGGGGAGGGGASAGSSGCGGNSGGTSFKYLPSLTPGNTLIVVVGGGGTGVSASAGGNGTASTVASGTQTISTITGSAGAGGTGPGGTGTNPTAGSGGDQNFPGNAGVLASIQPAGNQIGGNGAGSMFGGGAVGGFGSSAGGAAVANTGAGGGGAGGGGGSNTAGGNGGSGFVLFEWTN